GGGLGNGRPSMMQHLARGKWSAVDFGDATETLWWVFGFSSTEVYAVGEKGAIWRFDGSAATRLASPTTATLFGIWGAARDDVWAVGGPPAALLHYDGSNWARVEPPGLASGLGGVAYGSHENLFVVGLAGVKFRRDAAGKWTDDSDFQPRGDLHGVWVAP